MMNGEAKILVTGHTGFIGTRLVSLLKSKSLEVIGVSRSSGYDLLDPDTLSRVSEANYMVHLAACVGIAASLENPCKVYRENYLTTLNVLEFARKRKLPVLFMSSYMYGIQASPPTNENHSIQCLNPYSQSKRMGELLCEYYAQNFGLNITIIRPFNIYGPGQKSESVIAKLIEECSQNGIVKMRNPNQRRDFLWIDDAIMGLFTVIEAKEHGFNVYNLGSGKSYTVHEIVETIFKIIGKRSPVQWTDTGIKNEILETLCDHSKFANRFSWTPSVDLKEGLERLLKQ
jgi:nucleoside-diphosphate-sugar epimerase